MDFIEILIGSFLSVVGVGALIAVAIKKAIESKISTGFAIILEKTRRDLDKKDELRQKKLEAYQKYLSFAYRCRNYIIEFTVGDRRNRLLCVAQGVEASRNDALEYQEAYHDFLQNVRHLENVLYEYRVYLHVDAFSYLHLFKGQVVAFRQGLEGIVEQAKGVRIDTPEFTAMSPIMDELGEIARGLDRGFRDLDITMKKELFTDESVYWDKLPLSWQFVQDPEGEEDESANT